MKPQSIKKTPVALFKCVGGAHSPNGCGHKFVAKTPGSGAKCPKCGNVYVKHINAEQWSIKEKNKKQVTKKAKE